MMNNILFLSGFEVIKPDFGLFFWTVVAFGIFWLLMSKFAFGPIRDALKSREYDIQSALDESKLARQEMEKMNSENEKLLAEARAERAKILQEAKDTKNEIIKEAKDKAKQEAQKIVNSAQAEIENQKNEAMAAVKASAGNLALEIAEKVIRKELKSNPEQASFANTLAKEIKLN